MLVGEESIGTGLMSTHDPSGAGEPFASPGAVASRLRLRNLLCPIDFSEFSDRAFQYATCIARHFRAGLFLQHVLQPSVSSFLSAGEPVVAETLMDASLHQARADMRRLSAVARLQISRVESIVSMGNVREQLLAQIDGNEVDLVVLGTHGHKGISHLALGSVTVEIARHASCPVLAVCRPLRSFVSPDEPHPVHLSVILVATDFSINSDRALTLALRLALEWSAKVVLFHVVEKSEMHGKTAAVPEFHPYFDRQVSVAWEKVHRRTPVQSDYTATVAYEIRQGNPNDLIMQYALEANADLIVMGSRGAGERDTLWGSTVSTVMRDGRIPVLTVPNGARSPQLGD